MARAHCAHRCRECHALQARWTGRCGLCGSWNSLIPEEDGSEPSGGPVQGSWARPHWARPLLLAEIEARAGTPEAAIRSTGVEELDRVLAGGLVPGSVTLMGGEPGIGKSTLLLQAAAAMARSGARVLVVSAEESSHQVRLRAERLHAVAPGLWLVSETSLPGALAAAEEVSPDVVVVDSIQTVADPEVGSAPGTVAQVRQCAARLVQEARSRSTAMLLVGHVTKEGSLAGPRVLEHVVDTVVSFEGERHHALRLLRATKHRFGPTGELGLLEMTGSGLVGVPDPSGLLLGDRRAGLAGGVVLPAMEGQRPLLVEVQALVISTHATLPRRSAQGLEGGRVALLLAVLAKRGGLNLSQCDVFLSAVGGVRVVEPAADLALALALVSAVSDVPVPPDVVACGEVGLGGEIRQVAQIHRRLAEASRLGFRRAVVPASSPAGPSGLELIRASTLGEAVASVARLRGMPALATAPASVRGPAPARQHPPAPAQTPPPDRSPAPAQTPLPDHSLATAPARRPADGPGPRPGPVRTLTLVPSPARR